MHQYQQPMPPVPDRPKWARKRIILPAIVFSWFIGVGMGAAGDDSSSATPAAAEPRPTVTATETVTATATAEPEPAPTVTETKTVKVTATVTEDAADTSYDDGSSGGGSTGGGSAYYANCSEARAAGAAPLYRGDPGYGSHLDRDGDGDACE